MPNTNTVLNSYIHFLRTLVTVTVDRFFEIWREMLTGIFRSYVQAFLNPLNYLPIQGTAVPRILVELYSIPIREMQNAGQAFQTMAIDVLLATIAEVVQLPRELHHRVMALDDVCRLVLRTFSEMPLLALQSPAGQALQVVQQIDRSKSLVSRLAAIISFSIGRLLAPGKLLLTVIKKLISATLRIAGAVLVLSSLWELALVMNDKAARELWLNKALSQTHPRRYEHVRIRRRL